MSTLNKKVKKDNEEIQCYTHKVEYIIHSFAKNEEDAKKIVDDGNGFVASRIVTFIDSVSLKTNK